MSKGQKFFVCKHCGNLIGMIHNAGVPIVCCGEKMHELVANTTDAAQEKHVPVVNVDGELVHVCVGSAAHPMTEEHSIQWVYVQTNQGGHRKSLDPNQPPEADFAMTKGEKPIAVFAYCNLHGLWKTDLD